jgi:hypothetical protein
MASLKKATAKKTGAKKTPTPKKSGKTAVAKKTVTKKVADNKPAIKKGSKLACQVCGFAVTVDRICDCVEETYLICCETPMKPKRKAAVKK